MTHPLSPTSFGVAKDHRRSNAEAANAALKPEWLTIADSTEETPAAQEGRAIIYIDPSDGLLKIRFGNGTIRAIELKGFTLELTKTDLTITTGTLGITVS